MHLNGEIIGKLRRQGVEGKEARKRRSYGEQLKLFRAEGVDRKESSRFPCPPNCEGPGAPGYSIAPAPVGLFAASNRREDS